MVPKNKKLKLLKKVLVPVRLKKNYCLTKEDIFLSKKLCLADVQNWSANTMYYVLPRARLVKLPMPRDNSYVLSKYIHMYIHTKAEYYYNRSSYTFICLKSHQRIFFVYQGINLITIVLFHIFNRNCLNQ